MISWNFHKRDREHKFYSTTRPHLIIPTSSLSFITSAHTVSLYNLAGVSRRRKSSNGGKVTKIGIPLDGIRIFPQILHISVDRRSLLPLLMELELRLVPPLASRPSQHSDRRRTRLVPHHRLRIRRLSLNDRLLLRLLRLQLVIRSRSIPFQNRLSLPQRH